MHGQIAYGLVGADCDEVSALPNADPAIAEVFEWLKERGMAELVMMSMASAPCCARLRGSREDFLKNQSVLEWGLERCTGHEGRAPPPKHGLCKCLGLPVRQNRC